MNSYDKGVLIGLLVVALGNVTAVLNVLGLLSFGPLLFDTSVPQASFAISSLGALVAVMSMRREQAALAES